MSNILSLLPVEQKQSTSHPGRMLLFRNTLWVISWWIIHKHVLKENKLPCETVNKGDVVRELWDIENQKGAVERVLNISEEWVGNTVGTTWYLCICIVVSCVEVNSHCSPSLAVPTFNNSACTNSTVTYKWFKFHFEVSRALCSYANFGVLLSLY